MINEATQLKPKNLGGLAVRTFSSAADYVELEKSVRGVVSGEIKLTQEEFADIQAGFCNAFLGLSSQFDQSVQGDFRVKLEEKSAQIHAWASDLIDVVEGRINQKIDGPARFLRASLFGFDPLMDWSEPGGKNDDHPKFSAFNCAQDILRKLKGRLFTEYTGAMHPYVEDRYLQDGENWLRSLIQYNLNVTEIPAEPAEISAVITILSNSTRVVDPGKIELPPAEILKLPKGWLPVVNGLLDTTSKTLVDFSPDYYYTSTIPRHYIPGAKSSVFRDFLDIVFGGDSEKDRKILAVYETAAWTLTSDYTIPGFMTWIGTGGEGKGTIADVFTHMLGEANVESIGIKELEGEKYKRAKLAGKRLNLVNESGDSVPGEMCKKLTDNSIVTVEIKNGHPFKMRNNAKFLQMTNILPDARDKSRAFFRRNKNLVEFPNLLEDSINVPQIVEFVKRMNDPAELDALFSEVVDDYLSSLVDRGRFANEPTMEEAAINYERVANPSAAYIKHQASNGLIFVDLEDASIYAKKHNIPEFAYIKEEKTGKSLISLKKIVTKDARKWAQGEGLPVDSIDAKKIGAALEYLDFPNFATEKRVGKARPQAWTGVFIAPIYSESLRAFETLTTKSPNDKQKVVNDFERSDDELNDDMDNKNTLHAHAGMEKNQYRRKNDQSDTGSTSNLPGYPPGRSHGESTENKEIEDPSPAGTSSTPQITEEKCAGVEKNPFRHHPGIILENAVDSFERFSELILINIQDQCNKIL